MADPQDGENYCFSLPSGKGTSSGLADLSEDVVAFTTPSFVSRTFDFDFKKPCPPGLPSPNLPASIPFSHCFQKTYDLHSLLQLSDVTSSLAPSPLRGDPASYHPDSNAQLHREAFDRRSNSPDCISNDGKWLVSESESDFDSGSEINIVSVDATGRASRIGISYPALSQVQFDIVPLPSGLKGRLQKLERRAKVEVLHDVRPQRELTEQEEFIAWMNQDGVRMLLTPTSHASLKAWLDAGDKPSPFGIDCNTAAASPGEIFRVCVEEESDVEGREGCDAPVPGHKATDIITPINFYSPLGTYAGDCSDDDDGFDADVEN